MKLIKLMLAGMVVMAFAFGQDDTQGGQPPQGPPPCDPNAEYPVADPGPDGGCANYNDCNGNGAFDVGEPCGDGGGEPDPVWDAFIGTLHGDPPGTPQEAFDYAAAKVYELEVESGNMSQEEYDEGKAKAQGAFDAALADGKSPEEAFGDAMAAAGGDDGGGTCDRCGYVFTGEGDHHGHCDRCEYVFSGEGDQHGHCDKCDHIWSGDPDDHHGHCDHEGCDFVGNTQEEWENHFHDDGGTGGDHGGPPTNHWDGNCGAICSGMNDYYLDSDGDGDAEDGPYAVWHEDADGNSVDCGCGDADGGDHHGDGDQDSGDHGDGGDHDGPPPFNAIDANGDGLVNMDEARAFFSNDPEFNEDEFANDFARVDANSDGNVDEGEHDDEVVRQIAGDVFGDSMANGASPEDAFNNVAAAVHGYVVGGGRDSQENFDNARNAAWDAFQDALANGATPEDAFGAAMAAAGEANSDDGGN